MIQSTQVQEFVAETPERRALMTTKKARRYQRGCICKSENKEIWYGKYYPQPGAPQKRVQLGRCSEIDEKEARTALDDIVAALNKGPSQVLGGELVRRFVKQVYIPQKDENGDWRETTKQEAEGMFRRSILPDIGDVRCRDLRPEHLRAVLRRLREHGQIDRERASPDAASASSPRGGWKLVPTQWTEASSGRGGTSS